jgi:hypothetical protein
LGPGVYFKVNLYWFGTWYIFWGDITSLGPGNFWGDNYTGLGPGIFWVISLLVWALVYIFEVT